jgi:Uma2 family endonuclease
MHTMTFLTPVEKIQTDLDLFYPDCDGNPMADNTEQYRWIVIIKENLEIWFASMMEVFVAGDLLWYPIEGDNQTRLAPDVMVAIGRPKGRRGSYQQWKEAGIPPQVVFEILSPSNSLPEMEEKRQFYETYGVEEFYIYDPDRLKLKGYLRQRGKLLEIPVMNGWVSPRLNIRFSHLEGELEIYRPDGQKFLTSVELAQQAEDQKQRADQQKRRADQAEAQIQQVIQQADLQLQQIVVNLLRSGMAPLQIADITGTSIAQVERIQMENS